MKCDICGKREASVHLTEVVNNNINKLHLCDQCAQDKGQEIQSHFGLNDLLSGLMDFGPGMHDEKMESLSGVKCPLCGVTFYDIQRTGKLGCGICYDKFKEPISELLKKIHGAERHVGKMPMDSGEGVDREQDIVALKRKIDDLVKQEAFEQAALIRDKIKEIEQRFETEKYGTE